MKNPVPSTAAIAIHKLRLSETSLIVTWMTRDWGKVKTSARGALQPKSPFAGRIDLFHEVLITWQVSAHSDLHALKEVEIREPFPAGTLPYAAVLAAAYFARWMERVTEPQEPAAELFSLLARGIGYLREGKLEEKGISYFERELARLIGIHPAGALENPLTLLIQYAGRPVAGRDELLREIRKSTLPIEGTRRS